MPEYKDYLSDYLQAPHRAASRELFCYYEIDFFSSVFYRNHAPWEVNWRRCPDDFFLFPTLGEVSVHLESGVVTIAPGEFLMLSEGVPHALTLADEPIHGIRTTEQDHFVKPERGVKKLHQVAMHFRLADRFGRSLLARFSSVKGKLPSRSWSIESLKEITSLMMTDPESGRHRGAAMIRELLAFQLHRGMTLSPAPASGDPRVSLALERMEREFASSALSVDSLAREVGITAVQFRKLFARELKTNPRKFLNRLRLRKAAWMLRQTQASVKEVAARCGFTTDHYFHLAFRQEFGVTPSVYRSHSMALP